MSNWLDLSSSSNLLKSAYIQGFVDISGGDFIARNGNLYINGTSVLNNSVTINNTLTVSGELRATYPNNSIPANAILGGVGSDPNLDVVFTQDFQVNGDVSFNSKLYVAGTTVFNGAVSGITPTMVSLGNVDNTSDVNKPVSTATQNELNLKANLASPTFTGVPVAPTATAGTNTTQIATTAFVKTSVDNIIAGAPGALDTLNELAAALGDDANFATTITNYISDVSTNLAGEVTRAVSAEGVLTTSVADVSNNLASEVTRAVSAEGVLTTSVADVSNNLAGEVARAVSAEGVLTTAVSDVSNNLAGEVTRAVAAEGVLTSAVGDVSNNLASEVARAVAAEGVLTSAVGDVSNNLTNEVARAVAAEGVLTSAVADVSNNLTNEVARAVAAEGVLTTSVGDVSNNLAGEVARAVAAEGVLTTAFGDVSNNLASEVSRAVAAEGVLTTAVSDVSNNLAGEVTRALAAEVVLTTSVGDVSNNLAGEVTRAVAAEGVINNNLNLKAPISGPVFTDSLTVISGDVSFNSKLFVADGITVSGDIIPTVGSVFNLGSVAKPFGSIYINKNSINFLDQNDANATSTLSIESGGIQVSSGGTVNTTINSVNGRVGIGKSSNEASYTLDLSGTLYVSGDTTFAGIASAPTASSNTNTTQIATTAFVQTRIGEIINNAPGALDTLNELAAALGNDANFSTTITNYISDVSNNLAGEVTRAVAAEGVITTSVADVSANLASEVARAVAAEGLLTTAVGDVSNNLAGEVTRAVAAEGVLTTAVGDISNNLAGEVTRAVSAEGVLTTAVSDVSNNLVIEIARAIAAEGVLTTAFGDVSNNLAGEIARAVSAEGVLTTSVADVSNNLASEVTRALAAEGVLTTAVSDVSNNLAGEVTRAVSAEGLLTTAVSDVSNNLAIEIARAVSAEGVLTTAVGDVSNNLASEVTRAVSAEGVLTTSVADVSNNLAGEVTRALAAEGVLTTAVSDVSNNLDLNVSTINASVILKANLDSPSFMGTPLAPTASSNTNTTQIATTAFVQTRIGEIINNAPGALDTLNELAAALGNDANFSTTITNYISDVSNNLAGEVTRAIAAEGVLTTAVGDVSNNLAGEVTRAIAAEGVLTTSVGDVSNNLASEVTRAIAAEGVLTTALGDVSNNLASEVARAIAAEGVLTTSVADVSNNLAGEVTRAVAAEGVLTTAVGDVSNNLDLNVSLINTLLGNKANLASPTFTGTPIAPTATTGTNTTQIATTAFVATAVSAKADIASTNASLNLKANIASPTFTGTPMAPTATAGTNTTQIATTAFVATAVNGLGGSTVGLTSDQTITGIKTFTNGLKLNSALISTIPSPGSALSLNLNGIITQIGQDLDGEASNDRSGQSVSISADGSIVAIGAPQNDGNGSDSGHVRVYQYNGTSWNKIGQDIDGGTAGDQSGQSVAISADGSIVVIGANTNSQNGMFNGLVRVYQYNGTTWNKIGQDLYGNAAFVQFGLSVSISDNGLIIAIGGPNQGAGYVSVYQYNGTTTWTQLGQNINGEFSADSTGFSVSISADGSIVAIGAPFNDGNGNDSGHLRVYQYNGTSWNKLGQDIDGEAASDNSGYSVSINADGTIVAIGARHNDGNSADSGHVRVYQYNGTTWSQRGQDIDGEAAGDRTWSVSISADGSIVAIGAINNDGNGNDSGHLRVYQYNGTIWNKVAQDIDGEAAGDQSGISVSISDDGKFVAVGAINNSGKGHVRVYQLPYTPEEENIVIDDLSLTGIPTAPTAASGTNTTQIATTEFVTGLSIINRDISINGITLGRGGGDISSNAVFGVQALYLNTTGFNNTANGRQALNSNTSGSDNTANGREALYNNTTGNSNTANGDQAGLNNTTASNNTFIGAFTNISPTTATWTNSTALGYGAIITASNQVVLGRASETVVVPGAMAISNNSTVNGITIGKGSGNIATNTVLGFSSLTFNTTGYENVAIGHSILLNNTTGYRNVGIGVSSLFTNTSGYQNISLGRWNLFKNTEGFANVSAGFQSLYNNTTGSNNTGIGNLAGLNNTTASNNTFIGASTNISPINATWTNSTALGNSALITASNQIVLGNSSISSLNCQVQTITSLSDARDKKNIQPLTSGITFIDKLNPVKFDWNMRDGGKVDIPEMGFIAQDLQQVQEETGIVVPGLVSDSNPDRLEASYGTLIPILVKATQDLSAKLTTAEAKNAVLQSQLDNIMTILNNNNLS